jgi:hypothetical protein
MNVSGDNSNALILSTVLMSYQGLRVDMANDPEMYSPPVQWLHVSVANFLIFAARLKTASSLARFQFT